MRTRFTFILLLPILTHAQNSRFVERDLEDRLPDRFRVEIPPLRKEILDRLPVEPNADERTQRQAFRFADQVAFTISEEMASGYVYSDWPELENYVNTVLQRVLPKEPGAEKVHAYVVRDASFNASMTAAGYMFINIGMIAEVRSEAALAAALCHEYAHFKMQHGYGLYIHPQDRAIEHSARSIRMELQADSLGMVWLLASGYSIAGANDLLGALVRQEKQGERMRGGFKDHRRSTHPGAIERIDRFRTFYEKHKDAPGADQLVDGELFTALQAACWPEMLRVLLQGMDYDECIRKAFNAHILEPNDPLYVWYLMEAIRRMCYLDDDRWDELFIMDGFFEPAKEGMVHPEKSSAHLFTTFDQEVMAMDPVLLKRIQAKFYWQEELKFRTYREAYTFFERLGEALSCHECLLSSALLRSNVPAERDTFLDRYLAGPAKYNGFASALRENRVRSTLSGRLLVFTVLDGNIRQGKEDIPVRVNDGRHGEQLQRLMDTLSLALHGRRTVSLLALRDSSMEYYRRLNELFAFSLFPTFAKGERTELHVLDPRYYELFRTTGVNEVEFVGAAYWDIGRRQRTAEAYADAANTDYASIFDRNDGSRYLRVYVSSLREIEKSPMKARYYDGEYTMKAGRTGLSEFVGQITHALFGKDLHMKDVMVFGYH